METESKDEACAAQAPAASAEEASLNLCMGTFLTPQKDAAQVTSDLCTPEAFQSPMNFSSVTVEQLGITPESFVKCPAGKPPSYLKKSRRRSTVGARGSPETNHLIRFIAQQRNLKSAEKSPLVQGSPLQRSPGLHRNVNYLRERISAFQSAFHPIKENEHVPAQPVSPGRGGFMTSLTPKGGVCQKSEKSPKRRRLSSMDSSGNCVDAPVLPRFNVAAPPSTEGTFAAEDGLAEASEVSPETHLPQSSCLAGTSVPLAHLTGTSSGIKVADGAQDPIADRCMDISTCPAPKAWSKGALLDKRNCPSFETTPLCSVLKKPSGQQFVQGLQEHCHHRCEGEVCPNLTSDPAKCCEGQKSGDLGDDRGPASVTLRRRKRVTFGEDLSPELFDESLPANTPLRKGGTPVCKKILGSLSPLPDQPPVPEHLPQPPVPEHLPQPNFDDNEEDLENIEPQENIELPRVAFAVLSPLGKASAPETLSGTDTFSSSNNCELTSPRKVGRVTRTSSRRSQLIGFAEENVCNVHDPEVQPCKEKKVKRRNSQESKCPDRVQRKKNPAFKGCRKKRGRQKKAVQKSLYGERDIASKKPCLSPIPELPEFLEVTPSSPRFQRMESDDWNSGGELEEVKLPERNVLFPESPGDQQVNQGLNPDGPGLCSSCPESPTGLGKTTLDQDSSGESGAGRAWANSPSAVCPLAGGEEQETDSEKDRLAARSSKEQRVSSGHPKPHLTCQPQDFSLAKENEENLPRIFKIPEAECVGCEEPDDAEAPEGVSPSRCLLTGAQKGPARSEALAARMKGRHGEDPGRCPADSSGRDRKHTRRSQGDASGRALPLDTKGSQPPRGIIELDFQTLDLCKDLSDSIEQAFHRTSSRAKVRRSTRLQKDLEHEGLVWVTPPSCTARKTKRRTISTFDSGGVESLASRKGSMLSAQMPWGPPVLPSNGSSAATSALRGKRRKSFCTSALENTRNATQPRKKNASEPEEETSSNELSEV